MTFAPQKGYGKTSQHKKSRKIRIEDKVQAIAQNRCIEAERKYINKQINRVRKNSKNRV